LSLTRKPSFQTLETDDPALLELNSAVDKMVESSEVSSPLVILAPGELVVKKKIEDSFDIL